MNAVINIHKNVKTSNSLSIEILLIRLFPSIIYVLLRQMSLLN